jgi:hypothetical protein
MNVIDCEMDQWIEKLNEMMIFYISSK